MKINAIQIKNQIHQQVEDELADEEMIRILINHEPYTITMRSPGDEEDLVRGILFTEDVYLNKKKSPEIEIVEKNDKGFITKVNALISKEDIEHGIETKRNLMSVTSCGMCGKQDLDLSLGNKILENNLVLSSNDVLNMFEKMQASQILFSQSGGSHACGAFSESGEMLAIKEDIGRHNAVDKVIGNLLNHNKLSQAICLTVSGRLSYEIVSKCYKAGIPFLASVSAPSSLAVAYCQQLGITLLAFCRKDKVTVYTRAERMKS